MTDWLDDPVGRAASVKSLGDARTLDGRLESELQASWEDMSQEQVAGHESARRALSDRYKTLKRERGQGVEREGRAEERADARETRARQERERQERGRKQAGQGRRASSGRGRGRSAGRRGGGRRNRYYEQTGIPGFGRTTTGLVMQTVGMFVGLSAVYLLLSDRGSRAYSTLARGLKLGVDALVLPLDPLNPSGRPQGGASERLTTGTGAAGEAVEDATDATTDALVTGPSEGAVESFGRSVAGATGSFGISTAASRRHTRNVQNARRHVRPRARTR